MASGVFVNESGRILVSLFFWIGKRVTTLLPIFFYHKLAQSLLTMGLGRVVTPPGQLESFGDPKPGAGEFPVSSNNVAVFEEV